MKECQKIQKDLVAFLYGELDERETERVQHHIQECSHCEKELHNLKRIMGGADCLQEDIQGAVSSVDWDSLSSQITDSVFDKNTSPESIWTRIGKWLFPPKLKPVYAGLIVGILLGSVLTLLIFRMPPQKVQGKHFMVPPGFLEKVEIEMARRETVDYLQKSEYVILDLVQTDQPVSHWEDKTGTFRRAQNLLSKKRYIDPQLNKIQIAKAKDICDQIELLLFELIQIRGELNEEKMEEIQEYIKQKKILLKINLVKNELEKSEV
ncbi:zf-HC2 domain-containing protein [bacterium]|nr:zf-HC2 domain-containing protein [bacterium]